MSSKNLPISCVFCRKETTTSGLSNHVTRKHFPEQMSDAAVSAATKSTVTGRINAFDAMIRKCKTYYAAPTRCTNCNIDLDYFKRTNKFCSHECSASHSNTSRIRTDDSKRKTSESVKTFFQNNPDKKKTTGNQKSYCIVHFAKCSQCENIILSRPGKARTTCSRECNTNASVKSRPYRNGKRLNIYYTHKSGETILLESSWELEIAQFLDSLNIEWIRPEYIPWTDSTGKKRNYYPDFFLPKFNLYLDPKNPYAMSLDVEKMTIISHKVNILYGDKDNIKRLIEKLSI